MTNKTLVTALALSLIMAGSSVITEAEGPIYDESGNLILDVEQEGYKDNSTEQEEPELILDGEEYKSTEDDTREESSSLYFIQETKESKPKVQSKVKSSTSVNALATTSTTADPGAMIPASATFMEDSKAVIVSKGTQPISKVDIVDSLGLEANSWTVKGDTLSFDTAKLDNSTSGTYVFEITFADGSKSLFELRVLSAPILEDYWQQNITTFSKDKRSNTNKDLELISSTQSLKVSSLTIDGVTVPTSKYSIIGGTIIISKDYLTSLVSTERARVTVTYSGNTVVDFSLTITDDMEESTAVIPIDC